MRTIDRKPVAADRTGIAMRDPRAMLTVAWVFVTLNYVYCDVLALMDRTYLKEVLTGHVGGVEMTRGFLLGAAVLMEIPMGMVVLSWVLRPRANRITNILAGTLMTVVQIGSLFMGDAPTPSYLFFSAIEIGTTAFVVWYAWTWPAREARR